MGQRSYRQNCALALAADVIGERWSFLLIRDLLLGPRRFKDLQASLKGMGSNLLASRLRSLEAANIISRTKLESGGSGYRLTDSGRDLEPALLALVRWGFVHGAKKDASFHHLDEWDLVALKAFFNPQQTDNLAKTLQFDDGHFAGWIRIDQQSAAIGIGFRPHSDIIVNANVKALFVDTARPETLLHRGSARDLKHFMSAFSLPA